MIGYSWRHRSHRHCEREGYLGCDERVWGFQAGMAEECPKEVPDRTPGAQLQGDQCDACGAGDYEVILAGRRVKCQGCGTTYPIRRYRGCEVEWA
jgi:hypothetical protein